MNNNIVKKVTPLHYANQLFREGRWTESLKAYRDAWQANIYLRPHIKTNVVWLLRRFPVDELNALLVADVLRLMEVNNAILDSSCEKNIIKLVSLMHDAHAGRRAVGIASIPSREGGLKQAMESLAQQVDEFHIYLNDYPMVPAWLNSWSGAVVYTSQKFGVTGDSGKFFGYTQTEAPWYFTCDDDIIYPPDYAKVLIDASVHHKCPVGVHGSLLRYPVSGYYEENARHVLHFKWKNKVDRRVHILGTGTMLLDRRLITQLPRFDFPNMADIWVAKHMAQRGMAMYAVARPDHWLKDVEVPGNSIYSTNVSKRTDQSVIIGREVRLIGELALPVKGDRKKVMVAIKTFNRLDYLKQCIESLCRTACDEEYDIVVVVADDGSTDGTETYLASLSIPYELHVIRNQRAFVGGQFNSILRLGQSLAVDFYFIADDDVYFKKPGWMRGYIEAANQSGFDHLCHFNLPHFRQICERTKEVFPPPRRIHKHFPLDAHVGVRRAMGAFFTLTPAIIAKVGYADEVNFFVRGGWHGDYSARCCRAGFNEQGRFWDWMDSNDYLELQNTREENYRSAIAWESDDFKRASTPNERQRRESVKSMSRRVYVGAHAAIQDPLISIQEAMAVAPVTVNEVFDKVFVINLDRRKDRMEVMHRRLTRCGINYERISAVDGTTPEVQEQYRHYRAARPVPDPGARINSRDFYFGGKTDAQRTAHIEAGLNGPAIRSAGALAYSLTYRNILRHCIDEGIERVLILDDDCIFHKEFQAGFHAAYAELPTSWRIFQLGTMQYDWPLVEDYSERLYLPRGVLVASHAVGLHADSYPSLLDGIARMTMPFDIGPLQDTARLFSESSFICRPNLVIQDQSESDINSSDVAKDEALKKNNMYRWVISDYE